MEQSRKACRGHGRVTAHPHGLFHRADQNLPQLTVLVGQLQAACRLMRLRTVGHAASGVLDFEEGVQRTHAVPGGLSMLERCLQGDEG